MNALKVYSKQPDYSAWKSRLKIYQLDLQDLTSINNFLAFVEKIIPHLDILINNAAMTIWRPYSFYKDLIKEEIQPRVSVQGVKSLDGHSACLCRGLNFMK